MRRRQWRKPDSQWPNDLTVGDDKLGGILAEAITPSTVVVGLGLNVDWGDVALPPGATSLARVAGAPGDVDRPTLLSSYLRHLDHRRADLGSPAGRVQLLDDYRRACTTIGRAVAIDLGHERLEGTAIGITDAGNLMVTNEAGPREISAGDVIHAPSP